MTVAPLEPEKQKEWLDKAEEENLTRNELRQAIKQSKTSEEPKLPKGKFNVIYTDPPWQFANSGFMESAESHYNTITTEDICKMKIPDLVTDRAVLFIFPKYQVLSSLLN